ncbi:MAG: hypothetical protein LBQ62_08810 [Candidatus Accumulibacter sp.]|jgi:hypothetical protein|nr:hypothetical protein [Accumulibacter sp.]
MNPPPRRFFPRPERAWLARLAGALLLSCALPPPVAAQELGRLFFTPERRAALDRQRQFDIPERREIPEDPTLTIDGVVTRSSGRRTVWINGAARDDPQAAGVAIVPERANPGRVVVRSEDGPETRASVGDTVNRNTGETTGLLGGGEIRVKR